LGVLDRRRTRRCQ